jgi:hypothetical protein
MSQIFHLSIDKIQPSQLFISKRKFDITKSKYRQQGKKAFGIVPVKRLGCDIVYTDGHTRALVAYLAGIPELQVQWDTDVLDWEMYKICVNWCKKESIYRIQDLETRIIDHKQYEKQWIERCQIMHKKLEEKRKNRL